MPLLYRTNLDDEKKETKATMKNQISLDDEDENCGLRFNAKKIAAMPSTTLSQNCCKPGESTTAGSIYMLFEGMFKVK
ncbi:unnamed protein product [Dovyalis caffra]|uniref:Uncharacterized protein n=1 Tax=Dovyalis caffra TaxID=77055 RepID=A0AAV1S3Z6_9ROSI|nr:unnamed protein product [Dovyalis caffra]